MGLLLKIFQLLGAKFAKEAIVWTLFKVFITSLVLTAFPIAMSNALMILYDGLFSKINTYATNSVTSSTLSAVVINVTGITAFFVNHLNLIEAFNVVISAVALRLVLRFIPFLRF